MACFVMALTHSKGYMSSNAHIIKFCEQRSLFIVRRLNKNEISCTPYCVIFGLKYSHYFRMTHIAQTKNTIIITIIICLRLTPISR